MNHESINRQTKHVTDVHRIKAHLEALSSEEVDALIHEKQLNVSIRWEQCQRSFQMLFMALNRGNRFPEDTFDIRVKQELIDGMPVDTYIRVKRDRLTKGFVTRPFTRNGRIEDHEFSGERFCDTYEYRYNTYFSKSARLTVDHDAPDPTIKLERIDGYVVEEQDLKAKAIFLSAMENCVAPLLEQTEDTLIILSESVIDLELNPEHALKYRIKH